MPQAPTNRPILHAKVELAGLPRVERLDVWRAALEPVFEIIPHPAGDPAAFSGTITMAHLGDSLLSEVRSGPQTFKRSRAHARRSAW